MAVCGELLLAIERLRCGKMAPLFLPSCPVFHSVTHTVEHMGVCYTFDRVHAALSMNRRHTPHMNT